MDENSCSIDEKGSSCCSSQVSSNAGIDLKQHWDNAYLNSPEEKLGWYETDLNPTLNLIEYTKLDKKSRILNVGSGSTTLIDALLEKGYSNLIATDISKVALKNLEDRLQSDTVTFMVDDLTNPTDLNTMQPVDLWIDRAVLHFFTEDKDQETYFDLLKKNINSNGFALIAEFSLVGASKCSGLPIHQYSKEMIAEKLGDDFELLTSFDYTYIMPSGAKRPYIYTLFRKK